MITQLGHVTLFVSNQDSALQFFTEKLGFEKRDDDSTTMPNFRWLTVSPKNQPDVRIILMTPPPNLEGFVGKQAGWIFTTDDCRKDTEVFKSCGVKFTEESQEQFYGVQSIFQDNDGNSFLLIEPANRS